MDTSSKHERKVKGDNNKSSLQLLLVQIHGTGAEKEHEVDGCIFLFSVLSSL